jgi:plastocyanin
MSMRLLFAFVRLLRAGALAVILAASAAAAAAPGSSGGASWLGEDLPLPLTVKTPQDLAVKAVVERQYLLFNLLAGGKLAWDAGDYATAAAKWEALLRVRGLDPETERVIRPLTREARSRAGGQAAAPPVAAAPPAPAAPEETPLPGSGASEAAAALARLRSVAAPAAVVAVSGTVVGGGPIGPGGAVIFLKRAGGDTPAPAPARGKVVSQRGKMFIPHVLAVPVGTKVDFRNDDAIYHNIFSLSKPNDFDTGLYKQGASYTEVFKRPGPVQLLCNIHSSMLGYIYVVDSPYYTQADAGGAFAIRGVPPGEYDIQVWHEGSSKDARQRLTVGPDGVRGLVVRIAGDRRAPAFLPDKSGKPRQSQLGY